MRRLLPWIAWVGLALVLVGSLAVPTTARADGKMPTQRLVVDRVAIEPSPFEGLARLRVFVSALDLGRAGAVLEIAGQKTWKLKIGAGERRLPYLAGIYGSAETQTAIELIVETTYEYGRDTEAWSKMIAAIGTQLLPSLPANTQIAIVGYGDSLPSSFKLGPLKNAADKLAKLSPEAAAGAPKLMDTISRAMQALKKVKTDPPGQLVRKLVIVVSDGRDMNDDRGDITALGKKAGAPKDPIRIDSIAYVAVSAEDKGSKGPLLNLGELSKQSSGAFRLVRTSGGFDAIFENLAREIDHQYVLTFLVPAEEVSGKKLSLTTELGGKESESNVVKIPVLQCGDHDCAADEYCGGAVCTTHAVASGRGVLGWLLLLLGIAGGGLVLLLGVGLALTKLRKKPLPPPGDPATAAAASASFSGAAAMVSPGAAPASPGAPAAAAPPAAPPGSIQPIAPGYRPPMPQACLYVLTGPRTGERVPLRHGFTLGKAPGCDFLLDTDSFASGQHAQIVMDAGGNCTLVDMGSTNGTFVNGVRVPQYPLSHGVSIRVGSTELRFLSQ